MFEIPTVIIILLTFVLAGGVKGTVGLGLPTISLAILATTFDIRTGITLILIPTIVTNLWQALFGQHLKLLVKRLWPFLSCAAACIVVSSHALVVFEPAHLSVLLAIVLLTYAIVGLLGRTLSITPRAERWCGPVVGAINGLLGGMTGSFVVPGVLFLQSIGLEKERLIQAMGLLFLISTGTLAFSLQRLELLSPDLALLSTVAVIPALLGMRLGQKLRDRLPETTFRKIVYIALCALSVFILIKT